jgi:hypothetical protein
MPKYVVELSLFVEVVDDEAAEAIGEEVVAVLNEMRGRFFSALAQRSMEDLLVANVQEYEIATTREP